MKGKTLLSLAIIASVLLAIMPLAIVKAQEPNVIKLIFQETGTNELTKAPCQYFRLVVKIENAEPFTQYIIEITWNPAVLELKTGTESDIVQGPFMRTFGGTTFLVKTPLESGRIPEVTEILLTGEASGSGDLFYIDFHAKAVGDTVIHLQRAYILYGTEVLESHPYDATLHVPPPPATAPTAVISAPTSGQMFTVPVDVTLDGSASTDGFDTLPSPGHTCPITEWKWEIDLGNDGSIDDTVFGATAIYHFTETMVGPVGITLTVTAPDPTPPTAPDYVDHASTKVVILLTPPAAGPQIDVFVCRNGERQGEGPLGDYPWGWADAFGPQQMVTVCAKVTYNGEPVEYKPVGFEVVDPTNKSRDFRVVFTNEDGLACFSFRIPWEGSNAENLFGVWSVTGTVDIAETVVNDTVKFKFGYILNITDVAVSPGSQYKLNDITITVTVESISMIGRDALLTVVACDEVGVPIGVFKTFVTADPDTTTVFPEPTITIPKWAFVGTGTVYVNLFTDYPTLGGTPYCPEASAHFIILKTP